MKRYSLYTNRKTGLTLVEMLVTIALFTLMMGALIGGILFFYRANTYTFEQVVAVNSARKGVEFMVRDIREATYGDEGSYPIITASTSMFYFYSDVDRDDSVERIKYFMDGDILKKGETKPTGNPLVYNDVNETVSIISGDVRNPALGVDLFTYYDRTGTVMADLSDTISIAFVEVELVVNVNPTRLPNDFTLRGSSAMRNLKEEY